MKRRRGSHRLPLWAPALSMAARRAVGSFRLYSAV
jgi:hypothetical protein